MSPSRPSPRACRHRAGEPGRLDHHLLLGGAGHHRAADRMVAGRFGQVRMMVFSATMMFALMSLLSGFAWSLEPDRLSHHAGRGGRFMVPCRRR